MLKTCSKCGTEKPVSEFGSASPNKDGYNSWCKQCVRDAGTAFRKTSSGFYSQIKGRNKFYNDHPFKISRKDFIDWYENEPKICAYCDCPEETSVPFFKQYRNQADKLSVDCVNNDIGYVKGNLALACFYCNSVKSNFLSFDEMCKVGQEVIKPKWQAWLKENEEQ